MPRRDSWSCVSIHAAVPFSARQAFPVCPAQICSTVDPLAYELHAEDNLCLNCLGDPSFPDFGEGSTAPAAPTVARKAEWDQPDGTSWSTQLSKLPKIGTMLHSVRLTGAPAALLWPSLRCVPHAVASRGVSDTWDCLTMSMAESSVPTASRPGSPVSQHTLRGL
jgi:hypothetical protein